MKRKIVFFLIALSVTAVFAQDLPRIAVYVTGDVSENERTALGTVMLSSFINSGRYRGIERSNAFLAEIEREQVTQRSGAIDDSQISELGKRFGVKFVCVAAITPAFGSFQISARIVDVETAEVVFIGQAFSHLQSARELTRVSDEVVNIMFRGQAAPKSGPVTASPIVTATVGTPPVARAPVTVAPPSPPPAPRAPAKSSNSALFRTAITLDAVGAGLIVSGIIVDGNVGPYRGEDEYNKVKKSARNRNILYGIGAATLLGGISIHILF